MYKGIEVFNIRDFLTENNDGVIGENQLNKNRRHLLSIRCFFIQ